jgi:uncharacterized protein YbgA (DUF1722 family)
MLKAEEIRQGRLPLIVPLTLLKHHLKSLPRAGVGGTSSGAVLL